MEKGEKEEGQTKKSAEWRENGRVQSEVMLGIRTRLKMTEKLAVECSLNYEGGDEDEELGIGGKVRGLHLQS